MSGITNTFYYYEDRIIWDASIPLLSGNTYKPILSNTLMDAILDVGVGGSLIYIIYQYALRVLAIISSIHLIINIST
jgi:hypothetical protein